MYTMLAGVSHYLLKNKTLNFTDFCPQIHELSVTKVGNSFY